MKRSSHIFLIPLLISLFLSPPTWNAHAQNDLPVARAVLFYSPGCGHCQFVIQQTLPSLIEKYGSQLELIGVDITQPQGQVFFYAAQQMFNLETIGVPFLVIGQEYLIGSLDIPERFPTLIEKYLAAGGVDWPDIPGLRDAIHASQTAQAPTPMPTPLVASESTGTAVPAMEDTVPPPAGTFEFTEEVTETVWQRIMHDPVGNGLAVVVLVLMVSILIGSVVSFRNLPAKPLTTTGQILIPILCIIGLGVAGYLTYVEITQTMAICGPVGDCNTVQQSEYARLFGVLPIGALGVIGYLLIFLGWGIGRIRKERIAISGNLMTFGFSTFGIVFSIYLTFLEPFVIGATCAWCVTSAIIMTAIFLLTLPDARISLTRIKQPR